MGIPLRTLLSRRLALASLLSALGAAVCVFAAISIGFADVRRAALSMALQDVRGRFAMFGFVLSHVGSDVRAKGHAALAEFARRYPTRAAAEAASMESLRKAAAGLEVSEVYFIGRDGRIFATSYAPDQGLDLFALGTEFREFLRGRFGAGAFADQQLSASTKSGKNNYYQYYGPPGGEYLLEVSTRLAVAMPRSYPDRSYEELVELFLRPRPVMGKYISIRDYVAVNQHSFRSIFSDGPPAPDAAAVVEKARTSGSAAVSSGWRELHAVLLPLDPARYDFADDRFYAVFEVDYSAISKMGIAIFVAVALLSVGASLVAYVWARRTFDSLVAARLERLDAVLDRIAAGEGEEAYQDGLDDELSSIARSALAMARTIREQGAEKETANRLLREELERGAERQRDLAASLAEQETLYREIHHRVKNNLQVVSSLLSLQHDEATQEETTRALAAMRTRIQAMALVEGSLYDQPSLGRVPMQAYLDEIVADAVSTGRRHGVALAVRVSADGVEFEPDEAVLVGLIAGELASCCLDLASEGGSGGSLEVELAVNDGAASVSVRGEGACGGEGAPARTASRRIVEALASQLAAGARVELGGSRGHRVEWSRRC